MTRFEQFREFDRMTEELRGGRRVRQIPVDACLGGNEFKVKLDVPRRGSGLHRLGRRERRPRCAHVVAHWLPAEGDQIQITERAKGEFRRQLFLGQSLDRDDLTATCVDVVLTITVPVAEQAKARKVEVLSRRGHRGGHRAPWPASARRTGHMSIANEAFTGWRIQVQIQRRGSRRSRFEVGNLVGFLNPPGFTRTGATQ